MKSPVHKFSGKNKINVERKNSLKTTAQKNYKDITSTTLGTINSDSDDVDDPYDPPEFVEEYIRI